MARINAVNWMALINKFSFEFIGLNFILHWLQFLLKFTSSWYKFRFIQQFYVWRCKGKVYCLFQATLATHFINNKQNLRKRNTKSTNKQVAHDNRYHKISKWKEKLIAGIMFHHNMLEIPHELISNAGTQYVHVNMSYIYIYSIWIVLERCIACKQRELLHIFRFGFRMFDQNYTRADWVTILCMTNNTIN